MASFCLYKGKRFKKALSSDEQNKLLELKNQGDKNAEDMLVEHNLGLVAYTLDKHFKNIDEDLKEEYFSVGCLGLMKAIRNFNHSLEFDFSTYAIPMIYGEMRRFRRDNKSISISRSVQDLNHQILNLQKAYSDKHGGQELSTSELSDMLGIDQNEIELAIQSSMPTNSLQDVVFENSNKDDKSITLADSTPDPNSLIYKDLEEKEMYQEIYNTIQKLTPRERIVITSLFGLFNCEQKTQMELASEIGISQAQISRIKYSAIEKLKNMLP